MIIAEEIPTYERMVYFMKKWLAIMMMTLAFATTVFAEAETQEAAEAVEETAEAQAPVEVNWADVEESVKEIDAEFVTFDEIAIKVWMPKILEAAELTDEDKEQGYIGYFMTADQSAAIGVQYLDASGMTLDEYAGYLEENGGSGVQKMIVNGIECLNYDLTESDTTVLSYVTEAGYILEFAFAPISDEGFAATAALVMSSIQPAEEEAAAE